MHNSLFLGSISVSRAFLFNVWITALTLVLFVSPVRADQCISAVRAGSWSYVVNVESDQTVKATPTATQLSIYKESIDKINQFIFGHLGYPGTVFITVREAGEQALNFGFHDENLIPLLSETAWIFTNLGGENKRGYDPTVAHEYGHSVYWYNIRTFLKKKGISFNVLNEKFSLLLAQSSVDLLVALEELFADTIGVLVDLDLSSISRTVQQKVREVEGSRPRDPLVYLARDFAIDHKVESWKPAEGDPVHTFYSPVRSFVGRMIRKGVINESNKGEFVKVLVASISEYIVDISDEDTWHSSPEKLNRNLILSIESKMKTIGF